MISLSPVTFIKALIRLNTCDCVSTTTKQRLLLIWSLLLFRLTVFLAAFRYVFLSCKAHSASLSSSERTIIGVGVVVILSTILCVPSYIEHRIATVYVNHTSSITNITITSKGYRFEETALSRLLSIREKVFILHSVIFKLIPCALLLLFSFLLIQQLRHALQKSELLHRHSSSVVAGSINSTRVRARRREKENRRTTMMLVIVCVLFLVTELPQGALLLLTFLSKTHSVYYFQIYQQLGKHDEMALPSMTRLTLNSSSCLGDTFDILALINNSVNFILYCLMSRAFRDTFKQTFCFCQEFSRRPSRISFAQPPPTVKNRPRYLDPSAAYETVSTYKCADDYRTSTAPIIKSLSSDSSTKKKNRTRKALRFFQPATSIATWKSRTILFFCLIAFFSVSRSFFSTIKASIMNSEFARSPTIL